MKTLNGIAFNAEPEQAARRELTRSIRETLMHHSANQPSVADCAGDGTGGCQLISSHAAANHTPQTLLRIVSWLGAINSAPACAYVAGTPALILSLPHRANSPQ